MTTITHDTEFRRALEGLDASQQRAVAALFVENVLSLSDDERVARVVKVAANSDASDNELADALHAARAATSDCHTRCGAAGDWAEQAGYFVARAAVAAVTPEWQTTSGPALQAAMSSRMAQTCQSIVSGEDTAGQESREQYRILSEFLNS